MKSVVRRVSRQKGMEAKSGRWFGPMDASKHLLKYRYVRMFLIDASITLQNACPYRHDVNFCDDLNAVVAKERDQSLQIAAHTLRDERLYQVIRVRNDLHSGLRAAHTARLEMDQNSDTLVQLAWTFRIAWASGSWCRLCSEVLRH